MRGLKFVAIASALVGCNALLSIDDHAVAPGADGGAATDGGATSTDGGASSDAAGMGDASDAGACATGSLRCSANVPQACVAGIWTSSAACGGLTPFCASGVCGAYRTTGGVRSTGPEPATTAASTVRLVSGGFEHGTRTCNAQGVCVTGGIVP
jgi:hypothetical protein